MSQSLQDSAEPLNLLWSGDHGTGKTTDLCSMAHYGRIWIANVEQGVKARALRKHGIPIENIEIWPGEGETFSWEGIEAEWVRIREDLDKDPKSWAGVGVDSVTELQQKFAGLVGAAAVKKAAGRGVDRNPSVMDQDNWREANWYVTELMRRFRDLPCHFGLTALPRREQDPDGRVSYVPSVSPSIQTPLTGLVDIICWTDTVDFEDEEEEEFQGRFKRRGTTRGKDRFRAMPKAIVDPTFDRILQYIDGDLDVNSDMVMLAAKERRAALAEKAGKDKAAEPAAA